METGLLTNSSTCGSLKKRSRDEQRIVKRLIDGRRRPEKRASAASSRKSRKSASTRLVCALSRRAVPCGLSLTPGGTRFLFPAMADQRKKKKGKKRKEGGKKKKEREKKRIMNMHRAQTPAATTVCRHFAPGCQGPGSLRSSCMVNRTRSLAPRPRPTQLYAANLQLLQLTCRGSPPSNVSSRQERYTREIAAGERLSPISLLRFLSRLVSRSFRIYSSTRCTLLFGISAVRRESKFRDVVK